MLKIEVSAGLTITLQCLWTPVLHTDQALSITISLPTELLQGLFAVFFGKQKPLNPCPDQRKHNVIYHNYTYIHKIVKNQRI